MNIVDVDATRLFQGSGVAKSYNLPKKVLSSYQVLIEENDVLVKIPKLNGGYMKIALKHELDLVDGSKASIPEHWHDGFPVQVPRGGHLILFRHYYGFTPSDFGKRSVCRVEVVLKNSGGFQSILVNFYKINVLPREVSNLKEICYIESTEGTRILGTATNVVFRNLEPLPKSM